MQKNNFDFLRFFLALIVVLSHIVDLSQHPRIAFLKVFFDSHISVTGFFIISGYLITGSYLQTQNTKRYFVKRAQRLLPAYVFVVLVAALVFSFFSNFSILAYFTSPQLYKFLIANLSFLNFIEPCLPGLFGQNSLCTVNGALWTIKVEVTFYVFLPLLLKFVQSFKHKITALAIIYVLGLVYQYGLSLLAFSYPNLKSTCDLLSHQFPGFLTYFACGIALYYYKDWVLKNRKSITLIATPFFIIEYYLQFEILLPIALSLLLFYVAYGFSGLNQWGRYGDFSYGIYIYHFPLIQLAVAIGLFNMYSPFFVGAGLLLVLFLLSFLSWHLIEKRFLKRVSHAKLG